jgi:glycosyltransferase involved in cell wall biosynthesis
MKTQINEDIVFASFQGIHKGIPYGMAKTIVQILEKYSIEVKEKLTYYVSNVDGYEGDINIRPVSHLYRPISILLDLFNEHLFHFPTFKIRHIKERIFDCLLCIRIKKPKILISSTYLHWANRKNHKIGGINIFIAGNPSDLEIYEILKLEQAQRKIIIDDAYTYIMRVAYIKASIPTYDHYVTFTITQYESYLKSIDKSKISYTQNHILPNHKTFPMLGAKKCKIMTFCYVAHPFWLKGLIYLLEAWSGIRNRNVRLRIIGNISMEMKNYISSKHSKISGVQYDGWADDLNEILRSSHVCIIPSLLDAGPATVAEAMFCGMPVIVSDGCGARTLVKDGRNGFITQSGNSYDLREKIDWFIQNKESIPIMGENAKRTINALANSDQNIIASEHILLKIKNILDESKFAPSLD